MVNHPLCSQQPITDVKCVMHKIQSHGSGVAARRHPRHLCSNTRTWSSLQQCYLLAAGRALAKTGVLLGATRPWKCCCFMSYKKKDNRFKCACWQQGGRMGDAGHLLAAAAAATVLLLDLRRPALPLLTWKHGARMSTHMHLAYQLSGRLEAVRACQSDVFMPCSAC